MSALIFRFLFIKKKEDAAIDSMLVHIPAREIEDSSIRSEIMTWLLQHCRIDTTTDYFLSLHQNPSIMKLAEALSIRKDLQKRIQQLGQRIQNNVKVQEGDAPSEEPMELMKELDACLTQLEDLIWRINATNMQTNNAEGVTLTQLMARKDVLTMRVGNLRNIFETASAGQDRYSRSEIKTVTVVDVKAIGKQADECSAQLRQLDMEIQALNFQTELV